MRKREALLFLAQRIPYPPNKGDKLRSFAVLRHLAQFWDIHLGCFIDDPDDWRHVEALRSYCADLRCVGLNKRWATLRSLRGLLAGQALSEPYFHDVALARWVGATLRDVQPSAAFLYSSVMAQYLPPIRDTPAPRVVMDFVDVDSDKWSQYSRAQPWPMSWLYARESRRLLTYDRAVAARADASVFVSSAEAALFQRLAPEAAPKIHAISNGVDFDQFTPDAERAASPSPDPFPPGSRRIVFTGAMDYWPNIDAVIWFAEAMLPAIQAVLPQAVFCVVGGNPSPAVVALARRPGVIVTGRVPDIRPYLTHAEAVVAPLRVARGIQNKVLEGMAMAKIVITTAQGLEGIDAVAGRDLLMADDAAAFIAATIRALTDATLSPMGAAARRQAVAAYRWDDKLAAYQALLQTP